MENTDKMVSSEEKSSGKKKHSYVRFGKIAGIAGVCLLCVFAASMSSEANRKYLVNSVRILSGNDSQLISYNDETNEDASTEENDAIINIKENLDIEMPTFYYRPFGMEFLDYSIDTITCYATIKYEYENNILVFYINKQEGDSFSNIGSLNGKERIVANINKDGTEIIINEMEDQPDENSTYIASWKYETTVYSFVGKIQLEELKKIIEEMKF